MKIFIQWKGTDICADFTCECGSGFHFDGYFCYAIECPSCQKVFKLGTEVTFTQIDPDTDGVIIRIAEESGFTID